MADRASRPADSLLQHLVMTAEAAQPQRAFSQTELAVADAAELPATPSLGPIGSARKTLAAGANADSVESDVFSTCYCVG